MTADSGVTGRSEPGPILAVARRERGGIDAPRSTNVSLNRTSGGTFGFQLTLTCYTRDDTISP